MSRYTWNGGQLWKIAEALDITPDDIRVDYVGRGFGSRPCVGFVVDNPMLVMVAVTTVPQVCLDALDAADVLAGASSEALTLTASSLGEVPAAIDAVLAGDVAELERINAVLDENTDQMNTIDMEAIVTDYANARDACRGEA